MVWAGFSVHRSTRLNQGPALSSCEDSSKKRYASECLLCAVQVVSCALRMESHFLGNRWQGLLSVAGDHHQYHHRLFITWPLEPSGESPHSKFQATLRTHLIISASPTIIPSPLLSQRQLWTLNYTGKISSALVLEKFIVFTRVFPIQGLCLPHPSLTVSLTCELKLRLCFQAHGVLCSVCALTCLKA